MENMQSSPNQNPIETAVQQQVSSNNSKLLMIVVISVLVTAIASGSAVYFWQKLANEKAISSLEQKISFLEKQVSTIKNDVAAPQPIPSPPLFPTHTSPSGADTVNWKTYENKDLGYKFKYPQDWFLQNKQPDSATGMIDNITFEVAENDRLLVRFFTYQDSKTVGKTGKEHLQYYKSLTESSDGPAMTVSSVDKVINQSTDGIEILIGGVDVGKRVVFDKNKILFVFSPSIIAMSPDEQSEIETTLDQVLTTFEFAD